MWQNMDEKMCLRLHEQDMHRAFYGVSGSRSAKIGEPARLLGAFAAFQSLALAAGSLLSSQRLRRRLAE